jgi:alpha-L-fucosidase
MTTRRGFFQLATQTATAALLIPNQGPAAEQNDTHRATPHSGLPLLDLQQRFVDLRFGMFLHFNMATFQDREWGDPTSPADLFRPTALDTDQWAVAAQSVNMTWGCARPMACCPAFPLARSSRLEKLYHWRLFRSS